MSPIVNNSPHGKEGDRSGDHDSMGDDREENPSPNSDLTDRSTPEESHHSKRKSMYFIHLIFGTLVVCDPAYIVGRITLVRLCLVEMLG